MTTSPQTFDLANSYSSDALSPIPHSSPLRTISPAHAFPSISRNEIQRQDPRPPPMSKPILRPPPSLRNRPIPGKPARGLYRPRHGDRAGRWRIHDVSPAHKPAAPPPSQGFSSVEPRRCGSPVYSTTESEYSDTSTSTSTNTLSEIDTDSTSLSSFLAYLADSEQELKDAHAAYYSLDPLEQADYIPPIPEVDFCTRVTMLVLGAQQGGRLGEIDWEKAPMPQEMGAEEWVAMVGKLGDGDGGEGWQSLRAPWVGMWGEEGVRRVEARVRGIEVGDGDDYE